MVFLWVKAPYMADHQLIFCNSKCLPHAPPKLWTISVLLRINGIIQLHETASVLRSKQPFGRLRSTRKQIRNMCPHHGFIVPANRRFQIQSIRTVVGMTDTNRNACLLGLNKIIITKLRHMGMDHFVFWMFPIESAYCFFILVGSPGADRRHTKDSSSQRLNFIFIGAPLLPVNHEIKLHLASINAAIVIHHHRLRAAAVHDCKQVQYSCWFCCHKS